VSDEELREMAPKFVSTVIVAKETLCKPFLWRKEIDAAFEFGKQVRDQTEQRVRRETLEWVLDQTNILDANIYGVVTEELRRNAESGKEETKCTP
jgi:hypothetical protein